MSMVNTLNSIWNYSMEYFWRSGALYTDPMAPTLGVFIVRLRRKLINLAAKKVSLYGQY